MCLKVFEMIYAGLGIFLALLFCGYKICIAKIAYNQKFSTYVSFMTGMLLLFVLSSIVLAFFIKGVVLKLLVLLLGVSPFVIGKFVTYHSEKYFCILQILLFLMSVLCIVRV